MKEGRREGVGGGEEVEKEKECWCEPSTFVITNTPIDERATTVHTTYYLSPVRGCVAACFGTAIFINYSKETCIHQTVTGHKKLIQSSAEKVWSKYNKYNNNKYNNNRL